MQINMHGARARMKCRSRNGTQWRDGEAHMRALHSNSMLFNVIYGNMAPRTTMTDWLSLLFTRRVFRFRSNVFSFSVSLTMNFFVISSYESVR